MSIRWYWFFLCVRAFCVACPPLGKSGKLPPVGVSVGVLLPCSAPSSGKIPSSLERGVGEGSLFPLGELSEYYNFDKIVAFIYIVCYNEL